VSLADARVKARRLYDAVRVGRDPMEEQNAEKAAKAAAAQQALVRAKTFKDVAAAYIDAHEGSWAQREAPTAVGEHPRDVCLSEIR